MKGVVKMKQNNKKDLIGATLELQNNLMSNNLQTYNVFYDEIYSLKTQVEKLSDRLMVVSVIAGISFVLSGILFFTTIF